MAKSATANIGSTALLIAFSTDLIHHLGGFHVREQIETAPKYLPAFGIAAPCGFGRAPVRPGRLLTDKGSAAPVNYIDDILRDHVAAMEIFEDLMQR